MAWKEQIQKVSDQMDTVERLLRILQGQTAINTKRIEALRIIVEQGEKNRGRAIDRMADRMIEMMMVNRGDSAQAARHRQALDEDTGPSSDMWQDKSDVWPPPNCDVLNMP